MWLLLCVCIQGGTALPVHTSQALYSLGSLGPATFPRFSSSLPRSPRQSLFSHLKPCHRRAHHQSTRNPIKATLITLVFRPRLYQGVVINAPHCVHLTFPLITPVIYSCAFLQEACCARFPMGRFSASPLEANGLSILIATPPPPPPPKKPQTKKDMTFFAVRACVAVRIAPQMLVLSRNSH